MLYTHHFLMTQRKSIKHKVTYYPNIISILLWCIFDGYIFLVYHEFQPSLPKVSSRNIFRGCGSSLFHWLDALPDTRLLSKHTHSL